MKVLLSTFVLLILILHCTMSGQVPSAGSGLSSTNRPMAVDDLLRLESLRAAVMSPDGQWLAYERVRPLSTVKSIRNTLRMNDSDHTDIWIASVGDGRAVQITNGLPDDCGYFHPIWSPDGDKLAMYSTKGGGIHLWLWDRSTGHLLPLSDRSVEESLFGVTSARWLSDHDLVASVLPPGEAAKSFNFDSHGLSLQITHWNKAWAGKESTSSVLESGLASPLAAGSRGSLVRFDTNTRSQKVLSDGFFQQISISPDRKSYAALKRVTIRQPDAAHRQLQGIPWELNLQIGSFENDANVAVFSEYHVVDRSLAWSHDGHYLAFVATKDAPTWTNNHFYVYDTRNRSIMVPQQSVLLPVGGEYSGTGIAWNKKDDLIVLARPSSGAGRAEWCLLQAHQPARSITSHLSHVPGVLFLHPDGERFIGSSSGRLITISVNGGPPEDLTGTARPVKAIAWPTVRTAEQKQFYDQTLSVNTIIVSGDNNGNRTYTVVDINSRVERPYVLPSGHTSVEDYSEVSRALVSVSNNEGGTFLLVSKEGQSLGRPLATTNEFLGEIKDGQLRPISYVSLHGQGLKAWLLLPPSYSPQERYPLITSVYPGRIQGDIEPAWPWAKWDSNAHNIQLLSAHGFAVLLPSMPVEKGDGGSDPLLDLTSGVLPAVDKTIELGIADPNRLGLIGQSGGGYAVYGLISQTHRFHAAVAKAGIADLLSFYGTFDPRRRYDNDVLEYWGVLNPGILESDVPSRSGMSMGVPPWRDVDRYIRNSPITYVGRVNTPLLITSGDQDFVPMQQAEEFFSALYRQGKRARFVRYWGESHTYKSPANIRDQWKQIFDWFDEYLKPTVASTKTVK
jgi:dipeptidyl aminopeptidase/acylaminoacyl peptidase